MQILYSVYYTDEMNVRKKIDDKVVAVEDGIIDIQINKLYNSLTFVAQDLYISPDVIGDLVERIEIKYQIDNNPAVSLFFIIDGIDYLKDNNIKVYCKSKTVRYNHKYSGTLNATMETTGLKNLIDTLLPDVAIDYTNLTDVPFYFDYAIENKSIEEVIADLSKITGFEYYYYNGTLYFEDKKTIQEDTVAIQKFSELTDIIEFSTSTNRDDKKINKILINEKEEKEFIAKPSIALEIKESPQCCSPDEVLIYTDYENNTYKINPVNASFIIYYSPLIGRPKCNVSAQYGYRTVIEKFELKNDEYVELAGGISQIIAVDGATRYYYKRGYNLIVFDEPQTGEFKITYKTDVLYGTIGHSKYPKNVNFYIKHFNQEIDYTHKIELNGYYPTPYDFVLNLVSDWGLDYGDAIYKNVTISKKEGEVFVKVGTHTSNAFGELEFTINEYGTYKFEMEGQDPLYLDWYVNKKAIYMDEVE